MAIYGSNFVYRITGQNIKGGFIYKIFLKHSLMTEVGMKRVKENLVWVTNRF